MLNWAALISPAKSFTLSGLHKLPLHTEELKKLRGWLGAIKPSLPNEGRPDSETCGGWGDIPHINHHLGEVV